MGIKSKKAPAPKSRPKTEKKGMVAPLIAAGARMLGGAAISAVSSKILGSKGSSRTTSARRRSKSLYQRLLRAKINAKIQTEKLKPLRQLR